MGNIGEFVKKQRKLNNLKQEELALYAGGKETLKLDKVNQVLAIFDCELGPIKKY